jgi:hypothetical protein
MMCEHACGGNCGVHFAEGPDNTWYVRCVRGEPCGSTGQIGYDGIKAYDTANSGGAAATPRRDRPLWTSEDGPITHSHQKPGMADVRNIKAWEQAEGEIREMSGWPNGREVYFEEIKELGY